jgi:hypothetical protein
MPGCRIWAWGARGLRCTALFRPEGRAFRRRSALDRLPLAQLAQLAQLVTLGRHWGSACPKWAGKPAGRSWPSARPGEAPRLGRGPHAVAPCRGCRRDASTQSSQAALEASGARPTSGGGPVAIATRSGRRSSRRHRRARMMADVPVMVEVEVEAAPGSPGELVQHRVAAALASPRQSGGAGARGTSEEGTGGSAPQASTAWATKRPPTRSTRSGRPKAAVRTGPVTVSATGPAASTCPDRRTMA